jgi:penicillin-binding protein 1B
VAKSPPKAKSAAKPQAKPPAKRSFPWFKLLLTCSVLVLGALVYLDAQVRYGLNDRQWQLPARVYSRPLTLYPGKPMKAEDLARELRQLGYARGDDWRRPGSYRRRDNTFWVSSRGYQSSQGEVKPLRFQLRFNDELIERLETAGGGLLDRAQLEPQEIGSIYPRHKEDRLLVKLEEVPRSLREILLIIEDRHFYQHWGVSPRSIGRAMLANVKAGRTVQGGSTITQQLVKNVFLSSDRSLWRKGVEALMSVLVEFHFSKPEILESYLNEVYLGQEGAKAIHGFALASWHYFNRPLTELNSPQIALLVGMVKGPSYYDPWRNPERATERRNLVLQVMVEQQLISAEQLPGLQQQPLGLAKSNALANVYPAYLDLVRRQLRRDYSEQNLQTEGMKIFTAFDPVVQHYAEASMASFIDGQPEPLEGAMVVTNVNNGDVLAVVGGRNMRYAGFNRALDAVRPIGSLIKPAVYLAALQQPAKYTLATLISDGKVEVAGHDGSVWQPSNYDHIDHGDVLLHRALANSYNQATARLGMEVGLPAVIDVIKQLGVQRKMRELPSLLLGAKGMAPIEVAGMYQTIASAGIYSPLRSIVDIADNQHKIMARYPVVKKTVVDKPFMHLLHYAMLEVVQEGTGKGVYQQLPEGYLVAGKTGTTNDLRDSWFAGFAGDYLAVVWMGRDDNKSASLTGSSGALKVWRNFFATASSQPLDFSVPPGIVYRWVNDKNGLLSREVCVGARYLPFVQGSAPTERSDCQATLPGVFRWFKNLF